MSRSSQMPMFPRAALPVPVVLDAFRQNLQATDGATVIVNRLMLEDAVAHLERLTDTTPKVRRGSPETSHAAARRVARAQGHQHRLILEVLAAPGTAREIAARTRLLATPANPAGTLSAHAVGKRLHELAKAGYIVRTPEVRDGMGVYRLVARE